MTQCPRQNDIEAGNRRRSDSWYSKHSRRSTGKKFTAWFFLPAHNRLQNSTFLVRLLVENDHGYLLTPVQFLLVFDYPQQTRYARSGLLPSHEDEFFINDSSTEFKKKKKRSGKTTTKTTSTSTTLLIPY